MQALFCAERVFSGGATEVSVWKGVAWVWPPDQGGSRGAVANALDIEGVG